MAGYERVLVILEERVPLETLDAARDAAALEVLAEMVALWMVSDTYYQRYSLAQWVRLLLVCYIAPTSCTPESITGYSTEYPATSLFNKMLVRTQAHHPMLMDLVMIPSITPEQRLGCEITSIDAFRGWVSAARENGASQATALPASPAGDAGSGNAERGPFAEFSDGLGKLACRNCGAKAHRSRECTVKYNDALSKDPLLKKYNVVTAYIRKVMRSSEDE